jgi:UTP-glucose-1-phosphate uridylyltransferase
VPAPVTVNVLPETPQGPEEMLKVTDSPELAVALKEIGETP